MTMKKKALLYVFGFPFIYLYGLIENHFSFGMTVKGYTYEFFNELKQTIRILIGKEYRDDSIKVANYEFKQKSKKAKFDVDIAFQVAETFSRHWTRFDKKKRQLCYHWGSDSGDIWLYINQLNKDRFKLSFYDDTGWNRKRELTTEYIFTKEEVLTTIPMLKRK